MNDLDKNIDKLKEVVKVSTLMDTEKLDLIIFLDQVAIDESNTMEAEPKE